MAGRARRSLAVREIEHVQRPARAAQQSGRKPWVTPRTPWGHPDLQGIWDTASGIPLERPKELGTKAVLSAAEMAARRELAAKRQWELEKTNAELHRSNTDASK